MPSPAHTTAQANHAEAFERHARAKAAVGQVDPALSARPALLAKVSDPRADLDGEALVRNCKVAAGAVRDLTERLGTVWHGAEAMTATDATDRVEALSAALAGLPPEAEALRTGEADRAARDQRAVVAALEAEMASLAGGDDGGRGARVEAAAAAVRTLRSEHAAASLDVADAMLARLIAERGSLEALGRAWAGVAEVLGAMDGFAPRDVRAVTEQVVALGIEGVLRCAPLPEGALAVVEEFERERDEVAAGRAALVAAHGEGWCTEPLARLRKALALHARDDEQGENVRRYAAEVGLAGGDLTETLARVVAVREGAERIETDVRAARLIGPAFDGARTRCEDLTDALHRWGWIAGHDGDAPADAAVRRVLVQGSVLERAHLVDLLTGVLAVTVAHEEDFGTGWDDRAPEDARIEALTGLVADVDAMRDAGADRATAFDAVRKAAAVGGRLAAERASAALAEGSEVTGAARAAKDVHSRVRDLLGPVAGLGFKVGDLWRLAGTVEALRHEAGAANAALEDVAGCADLELVDPAMGLGEIAARLVLADACASRAAAVREAEDAMAMLDDLGLAATVALFERTGTPPEEWARKSLGLVAIGGDRVAPAPASVPPVPKVAVEQPRVVAEAPRIVLEPAPRPDAARGTPRVLFAVPSSDADGQWDDETFAGYATRGGRRTAERVGVA